MSSDTPLTDALLEARPRYDDRDSFLGLARDLERKLARCVEALTRIAAYGDEGANEYLAKTGSYGAFDEPYAVKEARAALSEAEGSP